LVHQSFDINTVLDIFFFCSAFGDGWKLERRTAVHDVAGAEKTPFLSTVEMEFKSIVGSESSVREDAECFEDNDNTL
jgi:hypothetical protein